MREDIINPDYPAKETKENRDSPSLSSPALGKENFGTTSPSFQAQARHGSDHRDHWEQEKAMLTLALTERLLRGRDTIAFSELKASPLLLHERLVNVGEMALAVLRHRAREIIRQEKPLVLQSQRRFDLDDAEIRAQLRQLRDMLAERLVFDKNELHAALAFGMRLQFDVITKPRAMLEQLAFRRATEQNKADLGVILQGLDRNHPFIEHVRNLLAEYPDGPVTKEAFSALCRRAEKEVYGRAVASALVTDLQTYQNFCAVIGPSSYHRIAAQTFLGMLDERGLQELGERVLPELTQQAWWAIPEIERLLEERMSISAAPSIPPETDEGLMAPEAEIGRLRQEAPNLLQKESTQAGTLEEKPLTPAEAQMAFDLAVAEMSGEWVSPEAKPGEVELPAPADGKEVTIPEATPMAVTTSTDTEVQDEPVILPGASELSEIAVEPPPEIAATPIATRPKIVYYQDENDVPPRINRLEAQPPGPYPAITRLVDEKSRRDFIKKIFHKDLEAYLAFVARLETMQTWKEAKAFLDKEFQARKVNPYSKESVHLSDLVFSRYFKWAR